MDSLQTLISASNHFLIKVFQALGELDGSPMKRCYSGFSRSLLCAVFVFVPEDQLILIFPASLGHEVSHGGVTKGGEINVCAERERAGRRKQKKTAT